MILRLGLALLALLTVLAGWQAWQRHQAERALAEARSQLDTARQEAGRLQAELEFARLSARVVTRYIDRVQVVRERAHAIAQEVPAHVTPSADARCPVPAGFVRVHDAAAQNLPVSRTAGDPDAPAPGLALSAVAATVAGNYATCHEIREQLIALQDWVRSVRAAETPGGPSP